MPIKISPVMKIFAEQENQRLADEVQARNDRLNLANEELQDQIRDLRENLYMRNEAEARRRRWQLSRMIHRRAMRF